MTAGSTTTSSYDVIPYISYSFPQTHPNTMATVASLFGMSPPAVDKAKVLELGCASGGNIIPMAEALPESTIVGIDYSAKQIEEGQATLDTLKLSNIQLQHKSILDIDADFGQFDYIICHGVYSWVIPEIQEKILDICKHNLTPQGVAYISYNTYPGWHMRGMIRDMMLFHSGKFEEPARRIKEARALLGFLSESVPSQDNAYGILLKTELELLQKQSDNYLFHDHLEEVNEPIYFYQFVQQANRHQLSYLGEVDVSSMWSRNLGEKVQKTLKGVESDVIQTEQYMDFVRNRMFRQTLLCHDDQKLSRHLGMESFYGKYLIAALTPTDKKASLEDTSPLEFESPNGPKMTTSMPLLKAVLVSLRECCPQSMRFEELIKDALKRLPGRDGEVPENEMKLLGQQLIKCFLARLVDVSVRPADFIMQINEKPQASPYTLLQAESGTMVTNRRHQTQRLNDLDRFLLKKLDGTNDIAALIEYMLESAAKGDITLKNSAGQQIDDPKQQREIFNADVHKSLVNLARRSMLIA